MVMIAAFSVGLAGVLVGLGLVLVTGGPVVSRLGGRATGRLAGWLPLTSASVVAVLGGAVAVSGAAALLG